MTLEGSILKPVPGLMALGVLGSSMKMASKSWNHKGKIKTKPMVRGAVDIMVGAALIGPVAGIVNSI